MTNPMIGGRRGETLGWISAGELWVDFESNILYEEREEYYEIQKAYNENNNILKGCWKARGTEF